MKEVEKKLGDLEEVLRADQTKHAKLEAEYEILQAKHQNFMDSFKPEDKEKYLRMAKQTLALLGSQADLEQSLLVPLTQQYPMVLVQPMVVKDLMFRKVMPVVPDLKSWTVPQKIIWISLLWKLRQHIVSN